MAIWNWFLGTGNWNSSGNWGLVSGFPNGVGEEVRFLTNNTSATGTIIASFASGSPFTVGSMVFGVDATKRFAIGGGPGTLVLEDTDGLATVTLSGTNSASADAVINTTALQLNSNANFNVAAGLEFALFGSITGTGTLQKSGAGILSIGTTGNNTFSGGVTIFEGTVRTDAAHVFNDGSVAIGGTLDLNGFSQTIGHLSSDSINIVSGTITNSSATAATLTINSSGVGFDAGVSIQNGTGAISVIKATTGTWETRADHTYTGSTTVGGGTLTLAGSGGAFQTSSVVNVSAGATFDISQITDAAATIKDTTNSGTIILGGKTLNVTQTFAHAGGGTFAGSLAGTDALVFTINNAFSNFDLSAGANTAQFTDWTDGVDTVSIYGNVNANSIVGSTRSDFLRGGLGGANDTLNGGANGAFGDTAEYIGATNGVSVSLSIVGQQDVGGGLGLDTLINIENLYGTPFDDTLIGDGNANLLDGLGSSDTLRGRGGNDTLRGGAAGSGFTGDTADLQDATGAINLTLDATGGAFVTAAGIDTDTLIGIENVIGGSAGDSLTGNASANALSGGGGADTLNGGGGADALTGGAAGDVFQFAFDDLQSGVIDRISDYTSGTDAIRILSNVGGDAVSTSAGNAIATFGNGYQIELTGKAGSVIRLDFTDRWEYWDTGSNASWSRYTDYLNAQGQISDQEIVNDNGTLTQRHVDLSPGGTLHAWIEYTDYYSAAPHTLTDQEIRYDNGTIGQRHIAQAGTLEYTDYVTPGGVLLDQEVINLNGTREQRHYDPTNTRSALWSSYTDFFNAANPAQITARSMVYDGTSFQDQWHYSTPGSTAHGTLYHYNNLGVLIGTEMF